MCALERFHLLVVVVVARRAFGVALDGVLGAVKGGEIAVLLARHRGFERVTVVKVAAPRQFHPQLLAVARAKALGIAAGADVGVAADDSHLAVIPTEGAHFCPEAAVKVAVVHEQALHLRAVQLALHRGAHRGN